MIIMIAIIISRMVRPAIHITSIISNESENMSVLTTTLPVLAAAVCDDTTRK